MHDPASLAGEIHWKGGVHMAHLIHRAAALVTALLVATVALPALAAKTVLNVGMAAIDAGRLDPHLSATTPDKALFNWMFNGLVRMKQGTMNPDSALMEGDLAESWKSSPDGKQWTFNCARTFNAIMAMASSPPTTSCTR
jgi:peptide/nickel transport system substrate-binding protein